MIKGLKHFKQKGNPIANTKAIIQRDNLRLTILDSDIIRVEFSNKRKFEDGMSQTILNRNFDLVEFDISEESGLLKVETSKLIVNYILNSEKLDANSIWIKIKSTCQEWRYGDKPQDNLKGTITTLDNIDGGAELPDGLISKDGWSIIDDSKSLILTEDGGIRRREYLDNEDLYFVAYGNDYKGFLKKFFRLAGQAPMLPRYALGNWWSRYFEYSDEDILNLMDDFKAHHIPLSVCIVDMDWHTPVWWTGYSWNRKLFKEPKDFISKLHNRGLKTALNLHPAQGVGPHEDAYEDMANLVGVKKGDPIEFRPDNENFLEGYFKYLHHPKEEIGLDFWWIDWQQENQLSIPELDVLWWLNHTHYMDLGRDGVKRPMVFSRWSMDGNHRYPIGFSGDTIVSWESLAFQPYFTSTASNVGSFWWSHDIGGHMCGLENGEMFTRWVQFGVFSPIFRIHSAKNIFQDRRPWVFDRNYSHIIKEYMNLRHRMIPYIYAINKKSEEGIPLIAPMYYYSNDKKAYNTPNQYYFGTELIVSPFVSKKIEKVNLSKNNTWIPKGEYFNFFTGEYFGGGRDYTIYGKLDDMPVFAKSGAIVPLNKTSEFGDVSNPKHIELALFPGTNNFSLYEDDGETQKYLNGECCTTEIKQRLENNRLIINILEPEGKLDLIPEGRTYCLNIKGINSPQKIKAINREREITVDYMYNNKNSTLVISDIEVGTSSLSIDIVLENEVINKECRNKEKLMDVLMAVELPNTDKAWIYENYEKLVEDIRVLDTLLEVPITGEIKEAVINTVLGR